MTTLHLLTDALARMDALMREKLDTLELTQGEGELVVRCIPHPFAGEPFTGRLRDDVAVGEQLDELAASGLVGTLAVEQTPAMYRARCWSTPKERAAWETRVQLAQTHPEAAELLARAGEVKAFQWRRDAAMDALHRAIWSADAALVGKSAAGVSASDLVDAAQLSRATFYKFLKDRPEDWQAAPAAPAAPSAPVASPLVPTAAAPSVPVASPPAAGAEGGAARPSFRASARGAQRAGAAAEPGAVSSRAGQLQPPNAQEVRAAMAWAESKGQHWQVPRAAAAVERWHEVTGYEWHGEHRTIQAVLAGHVKWTGTKKPEPVDLSIYHQLRDQDVFWNQRSWIVTPGVPAEDSMVLGADVNAQYVAAAGSVELGEGRLGHYEPGEPLPGETLRDTLKLSGWVRLGRAVEHAPHGLHLPADLWVPTPLAMYLHRDKGLQLEVSEALLWTEKRTALKVLAGIFKTWRAAFTGSHSEADADALAMAKGVYSKTLGGYLGSDKGLTSEEWQRPDWQWQLKAQAEANFLRALDKLPQGCIPRAKYADAVFVEVLPGASLGAWPRLDPTALGAFKLMGDGTPVPGGWFSEASNADEWRTTYAMGGE